MVSALVCQRSRANLVQALEKPVQTLVVGGSGIQSRGNRKVWGGRERGDKGMKIEVQQVFGAPSVTQGGTQENYIELCAEHLIVLERERERELCGERLIVLCRMITWE